MTALEIRAERIDDGSTTNRKVTATDCGYNVHGILFIGKMLQEIAAHLAEINERQRIAGTR